ncbi:MAG TPA: DUF4097 family beta strand repeat-containing protein [Arenimonas sp.]|uniref:DUF4097 family beta strand repeat-containing protein n=1 Tax=Arenimonas sp. TaxID=1872635 RepID=UPI002D80F31D|nr:DUF4097 family beta strand repeat-containing protein [Arenimonas sp.]HEU0154199.1 DUF4097 family beta strand repeat-containing protein [Arenimonas sp.]
MSTHALLRAAALASLVAGASALAATPINETRPLSATGSVSIENVKGLVTVRTWDQPRVRVTGSLGEGVEKLEIEGSGDRLSIVVRYPQRSGWFGWGNSSGEPSTLEVMVPAAASLKVSAVSADIDVDGTGGERLALESVSGDVLVRGARAGDASFETVSGDIDAEVASRSTRAETVSGDLRLRGAIDGQVELESVSGDVGLQAATLERLEASSVSGDADLTLSLAPGARITAETLSGNLVLRLPAGASGRLHAESFSGSIRSPVGEVQTEEYGPGSSLRTQLGDGSADLQLETFSGDIRITTGTAGD